MTTAYRDLASTELWLHSLERSQRRRELAEDARKQLTLRKHVSTAIATAMLAGPAAPLAMAGAGVRGEVADDSAATRAIRIKEGGLPLRLGSEGELVTQVQRALDVSADGFFGPQTDSAVRRFQSAAGLLSDGVVGPETWSALFASARSAKSAPAAASSSQASPVDMVSTETKQEIAKRLAGEQTGQRALASGGGEATAVTAVARREAGAGGDGSGDAGPDGTREPAGPDGTRKPAGRADPPAPRSLPVNDVTGDCSSTSISSPVDGTVTSEFGPRWGRHHDGIDISAPTGTAIKAAACGTVSFRGQQSGYGNIVCITHTSAFSTCYAHMSAFAVGSGQRVRTGQVIGYVGCTGHCTGPHLHFETRVNGRAQNPRPYLGGQSMRGTARQARVSRTSKAAVRKPANVMRVKASSVSSTASRGDSWQSGAQPAPATAPAPQPAPAEPAPAPAPQSPAAVQQSPAAVQQPVEAAPAPVESAPAPGAAPAPVEEVAAPEKQTSPAPAEPAATPVESGPADPAAAPVEPAAAPVESGPAEPASAPAEPAAPVEAAPVEPAGAPVGQAASPTGATETPVEEPTAPPEAAAQAATQAGP